MTTSNRLTLTLASLAIVTSAAAFGQLSPSGDGRNGHQDVRKSGNQAERYFVEDPAFGSNSRLLRPPTGFVNGDFPRLPASWFELSPERDLDRTSADSLLPRSPEVNDFLSRGAEKNRFRLPVNNVSMSNVFDRPMVSRRDPMNEGEPGEKGFFRNDPFQRDDERMPDRGSRNSESSARELEDPFTPIPPPDIESPATDAIDELITTRYQNPVTIRAVRAISSDQAMQLFAEVSQKIDERALAPTSYDIRVRRALRNLTIALDNEAFLNGLNLSTDSFQRDAFRNTLVRLAGTRKVRNYQDAFRVLNSVMAQAPAVKGVTPGVVGFEFSIASIDTLDKFSGLEPTDPSLQNEAAKDEHKSVVLEEEIVGVGLEVREDAEGLIVLNSLRGGPAAEAGVEPGDIIQSINGRDIRGMKMVSSMDLMKGPSGSQVKLRIHRKGRSELEFLLTRRIVRVWTVNDARILDGKDVGYFRLSRFSHSSPVELDHTLNSLHTEGMESLIIDLRGNPGGLLTTCVEISDRFVPCGTIVSTKGRLGSDNTIEEATYANTWSVPVVVLVDGESASASEIFAAAIQENKRGLVVGTHSYGKGTVQTHFPLISIPGDLRLTTAMFYSPNGRNMSGSGVIPDIEVYDHDGVLNGDEVLAEAVRVAQGQTLRNMAKASGMCRPQKSSATRSTSLDGIVDPSHPGTTVL